MELNGFWAGFVVCVAVAVSFTFGFALGCYVINSWWKDHGHEDFGPCSPRRKL